jgi:uncharacterized protein
LAELARLAQLAELAQLVASRAEIMTAIAAASPPDAAGLRGRLRLLVLQPTPFCNLSCDYCYLPQRDDRRRMSLDTVDAAVQQVFDGGLAAAQLSIVWHAGEPLVLPVSYYQDAFEIVQRRKSAGVDITHHFQTNATLIDDARCAMLRRPDVRVGVSIDGPAWLHDLHRRTRHGAGTHARVMRGVDKLRQHGIPFHVICVVTEASLHHADELFDFFVDLQPAAVCFNIEEVEGIHGRSSLAAPRTEVLFRKFIERVLERYRHDPPPFLIREVDDVLRGLRDPSFGTMTTNGQNEPFAILSVGSDGAISTFSPELLSIEHRRYGSLSFGNVHAGGVFDVLGDDRFRRALADVEAGTARCRASCEYFAFCRGGAPANKLAELGTFDATETMFCRLTQKAVVDVVLTALDRDLQHAGRPAWLSARAQPRNG